MNIIKEGLNIFTLIAVIILALLYSSFVEYCLHRFLLHSSYEHEHIKIHHKLYHGLESYELEQVDKFTILSGFWEIMRNVLLYLPAALLIAVNSLKYGILFFIVCLIYNGWEELLHFYFHKKSEVFLERLKLFKALKEHHKVHHYMYQYNFGIGSSFWDIIFKTKKRV